MQLTVTVLCTLVSLLIWDAYIAVSAFAGGLLSIIPQLFFTFIALGVSGATKSRLIVKMFKRGEAIKIVLTIVLLFFMFRWQGLDFPTLLGSFILCQLTHFGTAFNFKL